VTPGDLVGCRRHIYLAHLPVKALISWNPEHSENSPKIRANILFESIAQIGANC